MSYLLRRSFWFVITFLLISLLAFGLSKLAPGDPIEIYLKENPMDMGGNREQRAQQYRELNRQLGLDKPPFYFAIHAKAYSDTMYRIALPDKRDVLLSLSARYGNWTVAQHYFASLLRAEQELRQLPDSLQRGTAYPATLQQLQQLQRETDPERLAYHFDQIRQALHMDTVLLQSIQATWQHIQSQRQQLETQQRPGWLWIPQLTWYGADNQYHQYLTNFFRGDMGSSYRDGRPVAKRIGLALRWTLFINGFTLLLIFGISIPLGVFMALRRDTALDQYGSMVLFVLYSIPSFWVGTLLLILFTNPELDLKFFSITRVSELDADAGLWPWFMHYLRHSLLPIFCLTYGGLAFVTRQMRGSMLEVIRQDYIRTARAKGLQPGRIIWTHAFRNALFPLITLFANIFPALLAGSVVIEVIFNIPGMGDLMVSAINGQDWPVVYAILLLSAVLTMLGIVLSDLLYAKLDPRIRFQ